MKKKNIFKAWVIQCNQRRVSEGIKNNLKEAFQKRQQMKSQPTLSLPRKQNYMDCEARSYQPMSIQNNIKYPIANYTSIQPYSCKNDERKDLLAQWQKDYSRKFKMHHLLNDKLPKYFLKDALKEIKKFAISKELHLKRNAFI